MKYRKYLFFMMLITSIENRTTEITSSTLTWIGATVGCAILPAWVASQSPMPELRMFDIKKQYPAIVATTSAITLGTYLRDPKIIALAPLAGMAFYQKPKLDAVEKETLWKLTFFEEISERIRDGKDIKDLLPEKAFNSINEEDLSFKGIELCGRSGSQSIQYEKKNSTNYIYNMEGIKFMTFLIGHNRIQYISVNKESGETGIFEKNEAAIQEWMKESKKSFLGRYISLNSNDKGSYRNNWKTIGFLILSSSLIAASNYGIQFPGHQVLNNLK